jgi:hypothetical protein
MAFPSSPTNGQTIVLNNITYAYSSANSAWIKVPFAITNALNSSTFDEFSGNGTTTTFNLRYSVLNNASVIVTISGVTQSPDGTTYNTNSSQITFTSPPPVGTNNIIVLYLTNSTNGSANVNINSVTSNVVTANTLYIASQNVSAYIQSYIQQNTLSPFLLAGL